jgi:hypothetical protein
MKTERFFQCILDAQLMPDKARAIGLLECMTAQDFEHIFIELSEAFALFSHLNKNLRSNRSLQNLYAHLDTWNHPRTNPTEPCDLLEYADDDFYPDDAFETSDF